MESFKNIKIAVISSFAEDEVLYAESKKTETHKGGPALWITKVLEESLGCTLQIFTGKANARVKIIRKSNEENGSIVSVEPIILPETLGADLFIISTISDEFNFEDIKKMHGVVALDIQGFVRKLRTNNKKLRISEQIANKVSILKGTEEEVSHVDDKFLDDQKKRILIITKGEIGFDIFFHERKYEFIANPISVKNTIGAGDSLFAAFAVEFLRTKDILKSGEFAKIFVENFLKSKPNA